MRPLRLWEYAIFGMAALFFVVMWVYIDSHGPGSVTSHVSAVGPP